MTPTERATKLVRDIVRAGVAPPDAAPQLVPIVAAWDEDTAAEVSYWCAEAVLWQTDFVDWCIGRLPDALWDAVTAIGYGDRLAHWAWTRRAR